MVIHYFFHIAYIIYKVRKPRMTKLRQSVEVRARQPTVKITSGFIKPLYRKSWTYTGISGLNRCYTDGNPTGQRQRGSK